MPDETTEQCNHVRNLFSGDEVKKLTYDILSANLGKDGFPESLTVRVIERLALRFSVSPAMRLQATRYREQ